MIYPGYNDGISKIDIFYESGEFHSCTKDGEGKCSDEVLGYYKDIEITLDVIIIAMNIQILEFISLLEEYNQE